MDKNGNNRGGKRIGAGRKKKSLTEKILDGKEIKVLEVKENLEGIEMPPIKDYLKSKQKNGKDFGADEVYKETYLWLNKMGVEKLVSPQLVNQYAIAVSRWIQCEEAISEFGFLAKHPTTGMAMGSPYVAMSHSYQKEVNQNWMMIYDIVKNNSTVDVKGNNPQDDMMEHLLSIRRNKC